MRYFNDWVEISSILSIIFTWLVLEVVADLALLSIVSKRSSIMVDRRGLKKIDKKGLKLQVEYSLIIKDKVLF